MAAHLKRKPVRRRSLISFRSMLGTSGALTALLLSVPGLYGQTPDSLFRHVSIEPFGQIELGHPLEDGLEIATEVDDGLYLLPSGFGDTEGILISVSDSLDIDAIFFIYAPTKDYEAAVISYTESLGSPASGDSGVPGGACSVWTDHRTEFELARLTFDEHELVLAGMFDRTDILSDADGGCRLMTLAQVLVQGR